MKGCDLLERLTLRFAENSSEPLTRAELAKLLGVSAQSLWTWEQSKQPITARQVVNLLAKGMSTASARAQKSVIEPIVEYFDIDPEFSTHGKQLELFSPKLGIEHPYLKGLKDQFKNTRGIYIFYDSRGRALYAGKAAKRSLWDETKSALNRSREVQNIKRVSHPTRRVKFRKADEKSRQITKQDIALYDLAKYISAYSVPQGLIASLEALLVRGFANDLLNVRMERFMASTKQKTRKKRVVKRRRPRGRRAK